MIANFSSPQPGELLYSLCARYQDRMQYSKSGASIELFGGINSSAGVPLPRHLGHLAEALPSPNYFTVERMIDDHTHFSFHQPFLSREKADHIRTEMVGSSHTGISISVLIGRSSFRVQDWLRYCPACVIKDRRKFGECYWHRLHQVPGVEVCPKHNVFLESSSVRARLQANVDRYVTAGVATTSTLQRRLTPANPFHRYLKRWAGDVAWLLKQRNVSPGCERILDAYGALLIEKGLISRTGRTRRLKEDALDEALYKFIPRSFLNLYAPNKEVKAYRPFDPIKKLLRGSQAHPAHHLILIHLLGHTAESFFRMVSESGFSKDANLLKPFGESPWPCLNPAAPHLRELTINSCRITKSETHAGLLMGTFGCSSCGFIYTRTGPDNSLDDRFRFETIRSYGPVWEAALKRLWGDSSLAVIRIAALLGVRDGTVNHQATRLGLPYPRKGPNSWVTHANPEIIKKVARRQAEHDKKRENYRKIWLAAQKKHPGITRTDLVKRFKAAFSWLYCHDHQWLDEHKPPVNYGKHRRKNKLIAQDSKIAAEVRREALRLKNLAGCPVRVTKSLIARNLNRIKLVTKKTLGQLPLTTKAFNEVVDSRVEFITRRYEWTARRLQHEGKGLSKTAIIKGSALSCWPDPQTVAIAERVLRNILESDARTALAAA